MRLELSHFMKDIMNPAYKKSYNIEVLKEEYYKNKPFPHIVLEHFWDQEQISTATDQLEALSEDIWNQARDPLANDVIVQRKKMGINRPEMLQGQAPELVKMMNYLNSSECCQWISELTGIPNLIADPTNQGGGIHRSRTGGKLSIHADFNLHEKLMIHRRVNILIYLNRDWDEKWGGELELWDSSMTACQKKVSPLFNRVVIFNTTGDALHGHPNPLECPEDRSRLSLAYYYYTNDIPEQKWRTTWYKRPGIGY